MGAASSSVNPPGGVYVPGSSTDCDYCPRSAEWRFRRLVPVIGPTLERCTHTLGCGIHWSVAQAAARTDPR